MNLKHLFIGLATAAGLVLLGFIGVNVADYVRYHRAIARAKALSPEQLQNLGQWAKRLEKNVQFDQEHVPAELKPLAPLSGTLGKKSAEISLYQLGEIYLILRIDTFKDNQRICYFTNSEGGQTTVSLWWQNPELFKKLAPTNRILTVKGWSLTGCYDWVVLPEAIWVIYRSEFEGHGDQLIASRALTAQDHATIVNRIRAIPSEIRGKVYEANGVSDGEWLHFCFTPNGEQSASDLTVVNTWIPEIGPLLDAINQFGPPNFPIEFQRQTAQEVFGRPHSVQSLKDSMDRPRWIEPTPWWCVWRSLLQKL